MHLKRRSEVLPGRARVESKGSGRPGHALYQMGNYADSIRSYHTAISMNPEGVGGSSSTTWVLHMHHWSFFRMQ